jgi:beta-lactamase class A
LWANIAAYDGLDVRDWEPSRWTDYLQALRALPDATKAAAAESYLSAPPVEAEPRTIARLLAALVRGDLLEARHTERLVGLLDRAENSARLGALRPPGIPRPAHKTGTLLGGGHAMVAVVGMFRLPSGGELVVAVYARGGEAQLRDLEKAVAEIARTALDFRLLMGA